MSVEIAKSPQISHFLNLHDSSVDRHLDAASRKSVEIQEYCTSQKEQPFRSKNWCKFHFLTALILHSFKFC